MRPRPRGLLLCALLCGVALSGCPEWLEIDDGEEAIEVPAASPIALPSALATASGEGPYVPRTPGLRVPLAGYWTRARLDALDLLFPFTWVAVDQGDGRLVVRLDASHGQTESGYGLGTSLRAVLPIALPPGTDASALRDGFVLGADGLAGSVVALRTSNQDLWQLEVSRFELTTVTPRLMVGEIEGTARRGAQGQRGRRVLVGFVALRADAPMP